MSSRKISGSLFPDLVEDKFHRNDRGIYCKLKLAVLQKTEIVFFRMLRTSQDNIGLIRV